MRRPLAALGSAVALVLVGCAPVGGDTGIDGRPTDRTDDRRVAVVECDGRAVSVAADVARQRVTGVCPEVRIEGTDLAIDLADAEVAAVRVRGDRIDVTAADIGSVDIQGQENVVTADSIGAVQIRGDRNDVSSRGAIGGAGIAGNDNRVSAQTIGEVDDDGERNSLDVVD